MSVEAAKKMFAEAGIILHGHHSHGHQPYASHDPPRLAHGGWYPPGTGPFRPGPGAPSFGARMPDENAPGVSFGAASLAYGGKSLAIGSSQRWRANIHLHQPPAQASVGGVKKLTAPKIAEIRQVLVDALHGGLTKARQLPPNASAAQVWASKLGTAERLHTMLTTSKVDLLGDMIRKAKADQASALKAQAQGALNAWTGNDQAAQVKEQMQNALNAWGGAQGGGGGSSSSYDASANVNLPSPSASASLKF